MHVITSAHATTSELHLADLATFLDVLRLGSIHGAARALGVTPSQVSKAVIRLEEHLELKLLQRSARGVTVSDAGRELAPRFEEILARVHSLQPSRGATETQLTLAASSFMNALFLPAIVEALPAHRVRSLEMPPGVAGAYASEPFFDLALTAGNERWPDSWVKAAVGPLRQGLFASPALARRLGGPKVALDAVRATRFIVPIYNYRGRVMSGDDGCPLPVSERRIGHETQTLALALTLAQRVDQLVFAPLLAVSAFVAPGALVELEVDGWDVDEPLSLVCHGDRVGVQVQRRMLAALKRGLKRAVAPAGDGPGGAAPEREELTRTLP
jgi:DNA-binding transcriptional LysR family regulator